MLSILRIFLISGLAIALLPGVQGLTGIVLDHQNHPIGFASVLHSKSQSWTLSDERGYFLFPSGINQGDSLLISRIGFKTATMALGQSNAVIIHLNRDIISIDAVDVEGSFSFGNTDWKKESLSSTDQMSRNSMLQSVPGSIIKTYGGKAGVILQTLDGGTPEHTKIVLDGIDLTSPQNGLTDLSEIPKLFYQQVFLSKNPGIEFGSGAMDGVIHLRPWMNQSSIMFSMGSFGEENEAVAYTFPGSKTTFHLLGGRSKEKGNYAYSSGDSSAIRMNNDFNQVFGGCQIRYLHDPNTLINGSLFLSDSDRGAAGSISYPSSESRRSNELILANARVVHLFPFGNISANLSHRFNDEHYLDSSSEINEHHVSSDKMSVDWTQKWTEKLSTVSSVSIRQEAILKSTNVGSQKRKHLESRFVAHFLPLPLFSIRTGVRFDKSIKQNTTYHIQCKLGLPFSGQLTVGTGTGFRLPTFNDLYWPDGAYTAGNTSLVAEENSMKSLGIDFPLIKNGSVGMQWRIRKSTNLIKWAAGSDWIWRPENLDKTSRETATISVTIPQWIRGLSISGNVSIIDTKDESTGNSLEYVPDQTAFIQFGYTREFVSVDIQGHFTGERTYTGYDSNFNSIEKTIDPISNVTLGIHAAIPWMRSAQCHFVINNVLDRDIAFFPDYPEPGTSVTAGMSINF